MSRQVAEKAAPAPAPEAPEKKLAKPAQRLSPGQLCRPCGGSGRDADNLICKNCKGCGQEPGAPNTPLNA